ncbi:TPA: hypothetical protein QFC75_000771 [Enterococcus faecium]
MKFILEERDDKLLKYAEVCNTIWLVLNIIGTLLIASAVYSFGENVTSFSNSFTSSTQTNEYAGSALLVFIMGTIISVLFFFILKLIINHLKNTAEIKAILKKNSTNNI